MESINHNLLAATTLTKHVGMSTIHGEAVLFCFFKKKVYLFLSLHLEDDSFHIKKLTPPMHAGNEQEELMCSYK